MRNSTSTTDPMVLEAIKRVTVILRLLQKPELKRAAELRASLRFAMPGQNFALILFKTRNAPTGRCYSKMNLG
jgi:hypothetical protein